MKILLRQARYYFQGAKIIQNNLQKTPVSQNNISNKKRLDFIRIPNPQYLTERLKMFNHIKDQNKKIMDQAEKKDITITLKDGRQIRGKAFQTTPLNILKHFSRQIGQNSLAARAKYTNKYESPFNKGITCIQTQQQNNTQFHNQQQQIIDLSRPLQGDCCLQFLTFEEKIGKSIFWHSSSHLLGQCLQNLFGVWLCHGPAIDNGFFYDSYIGDHRISQSDFDSLQKQIKSYTKQKQFFQRILLQKNEALELFSYNPFKVELIKSKIPQGGLTTAYRCGKLIDLCTGPHLLSTDKIKSFKVTKNSSAYWLGQKENQGLQRVYGISFPKQNQLDQYLKLQEQLAKKDHRFIGVQQQLFNFSNLSPGSPLFFPHGTVIYNRLIQLMRSEYNIRGYKQVISPNIYHSELWKMSGHYFKYKQNIFFFKQQQGQQHGLKPMNCPGHCLMFDLMQKSYRDMPIRMADFGVLHRNEIHGTLSGLTRVRRFQQDDAHIFCTFDQIQAEILAVLDLLDYVYSIFGFKYILELSTRPEKYLGHIQEWNKAEEQLKQALKKFGKDYKINEGDGAFYGPKIDVKLFDVFGRQHQCGTIQLDFQLPLRFNLQYRAKQIKQNIEIIQEQDTNKIISECNHDHSDLPHETIQVQQSAQEKYAKIGHLKQGFARPVIIHRAIFGSLQRFIAILCQHTGGKWDFWLSPRQIKLVTVNNQCVEFAQKIYNTLLLKGYSVQIDSKWDTLNKKIRKAQLQGFNYIGVIGKEQSNSQTVNLRKRDQTKQMGRMNIQSIVALFESLKPPKSKKRLQTQQKSLDYKQ